MSIRYVVRPQKPEDLSDVRARIPDVDAQLPKPADNLRREIEVHLTPSRSALYVLMTRKTEAGFIWICPSVEFSAENEEGLFALCDQFHFPKPTHLVRSHVN